MKQARPHNASAGELGSQDASKKPAPPSASVPELLLRHQPARQKRSTRIPGLPVVCFGIGIALGVGISGPLPERFGGLLAGMIHAPDSLAAMVEPLGIGNRRILVMGTDEGGGNTDVMFTVQIDGDTTRITQVPRDTFIESYEFGVLKANALRALAGVDAAKGEISRLLGSPIERHLSVNLDAVAKLADAMGGVEIDVPKRMHYVDNTQGLYIDLYPGLQQLQGDDLEGFLRFRHDELGDLGRLDRQRQVINKVFARLAEPTTIARLPALLKILGEDIQTDLSPIELTQVVAAMARTTLQTERLAGYLYWHDDLSYWMPDGTIATSSYSSSFGLDSVDSLGDGESQLSSSDTTVTARTVDTHAVSDDPVVTSHHEADTDNNNPEIYRSYDDSYESSYDSTYDDRYDVDDSSSI